MEQRLSLLLSCFRRKIRTDEQFSQHSRDLRERFRPEEWFRLKQRASIQLSGQNSTFSLFPMTVLEVLEGKPLPALGAKYAQVMKAYKGIWKEPRLQYADSWRKQVWNQLTFDIQKDYFAANQIESTMINRAEFEHAMYDHEQLLYQLGFLNRPVTEQIYMDNTNAEPQLMQNVLDRMYWIPPDENYEFVDNTPWQVVGKGISFIYRRSAPLKPAWTVMAYGGGGTHGYHYERHRSGLTLRERARIQTFTDDFVFCAPGVRAQVGEAVPPLMGQRIAELIGEILSGVP